MAVKRYAGLRRNLLLATAISATLSGCASVEATKVADNGRINQVVAMPKQATETAYATPGSANTVATLNTATATPDPTATGPAAKLAMAQPAVSTGEPILMQPIVSDTSGANPLAQAVTTPGAELAYATPALVALPQPRPDIIAAANSIPTAGGEDTPASVKTQTAQGSSAEKEITGLDQRMASAEQMTASPLLTSDVAIPTPRPDPQSMGLEAYANTPAMLALDAYDTSAPKQEEIVAEPGIAPSGKLQQLIKKYAALYEVPEALIHRVVRRESRYNPAAYSRGNYGLMQIRYNTARSLGYEGTPSGLFDAETNLKYAVKYLRGAFMVADNNHDNAMRLYARGYYYDAKRKGLLAQVQ